MRFARPDTSCAAAVSSLDIDPQTARAHGIKPGPRRGVLNVVVLRDKADGPETRSKIRATSVNLAGERKTIRLREP